MKLTVTHTLTLPLPAPARAIEHVLLWALPTQQQRVEHWSIDMPGFSDAASFRDGFGNKAYLVSQSKPGEALTVTVNGTVETIDKAGVVGRLDFDIPPAVYRRPTDLTKADPALIEGLDPSHGRIALLHELMARVGEKLGAPSQSQDQDGQEQSLGTADPAAHAHAFIGAARALDIPSRFVTGYLLAEDGGASFHAWAEACDERLGWIGFDPVLNLCPVERHIRIAAGLDATSTMKLRTVPAGLEIANETIEIIEG